MTKRVSILMLALIALALAAPVFAAEEAKEVRVSGWVVCECCGKGNANAEGKACVLGCHKGGATLVLYSPQGDKTYALDGPAAAEHVGHEVVAVGKLSKDGKTLVVSRFEKAKKA